MKDLMGMMKAAQEMKGRMEDLQIVLQNLATAAAMPRSNWLAWPHVELKIPDGPWPAAGPLDLGTAKFIP